MDKVNEYFNNLKNWKNEADELRIILNKHLDETFKWRGPCYLNQDKNICMIASLKESIVIGFFKGALLKDPDHLLESPGKNSQEMMYFRFHSTHEIRENQNQIETFIREAIQNELDGKKIIKTKSKEIEFVPELLELFQEDEELQDAFNALTPGRQRAYNIFFADAKQSETRIRRIEKYRDHIMDGKGMNDYK